MAMVPFFLHHFSTASDTTLLPIFPMPHCSFLTCDISVGEKVLSLDVTVVLLIYTEKLFYSRSDNNQEAIREQYKLGSDYRER